MRTIQQIYRLYNIEELKDKAKEKAYGNWLCNALEYFSAFENRHTLNKFCELFNIHCINYFYDSCNYNYSFRSDLDGNVENLSGIRLATYLYNNYYSDIFQPKTYYSKGYKKERRSRIFFHSDCPLTGYYMDCSILSPLYGFLKAPKTDKNYTFYNLLDDCLRAFFLACRDDYNYCSSEEYFKEESTRNNWEYLADGTFFKETV